MAFALARLVVVPVNAQETAFWAQKVSEVRIFEERLLWTGAQTPPEAESKALYELVYELSNRPDWVRIPLTGVLRLLPSDVDAAGAESKQREFAS